MGRRVIVRIWLGLAGLMLCTFGCGPATERNVGDGRLALFAGIPPVRYLVEQIGGKHVTVGTLVQPGQDPHTFQSGPRQIAALSRAVIFFEVGMPVETEIVQRVRRDNTRLTIVDVTKGIEKLPLIAPCREEHDHGHHAAHGSEESDLHVWLSPPLLKTMAATIAEALCKADSAHAADYRRNLSAFDRRLDALHRQVERRLAPYRGRSFYVFHPGFAYFARTYGLKEEAIQLGGQMPTGKHLVALIERAKREGMTTVFVQPEFDPRNAQAVADAIGGKVVQINGLGENVIADIEDIATKIENAMRQNKLEGTKREEDGNPGGRKLSATPFSTVMALYRQLPPSAFCPK